MDLFLLFHWGNLEVRCLRPAGSLSLISTSMLQATLSVTTTRQFISRARCALLRPLITVPGHSHLFSYYPPTRTISTRRIDPHTHALTTPSVHLTRSDAQRKTIYALSTPPGKGGVAVIRVSGPEALDVWRKMVRPYKNRSHPTSWKLERCKIVHPKNPNEVIDDGLSVFFKGEKSSYLLCLELVVFILNLAPKSFTTEPTLELHTHSGRALINTLLGALSTLPFLRPAEPGEFTKRAFLNGRLDLTEVEGLADLIDAETEEQRKIAGRGAWVGEIRMAHTLFFHILMHTIFFQGRDSENS